MYLSSVNTSTVIRLTGVDSSKFLQGQLTCDVARLETGQWTWAAACSPKGRVIDVFKLYKQQTEDFLLLCWSEDAGQRLLTHLAKYKVFFKCELRIEPELECVGTLSRHADIRAELNLYPGWAILGSHNQVLQDVKQANRRRLSQSLPEDQLYWSELVVSSGTVDGANKDNRGHATLGALRSRFASTKDDDYLWQAAMLALGIPRLDADNSESFTAHALGLHSLGAISFSKGCFTGQEIVARTHYLGSAKKYPVGLAVVEETFRSHSETGNDRLFLDGSELDTFLTEHNAKVLECIDMPQVIADSSTKQSDPSVRSLFSPFKRICLAVLDPEKI
ncbi:YgfZ/GcvT domain-containing protein [Allohahella sp. A8]|uniref:CAF17-like 4Fe-4S cluster assembly/insertion protein YgfZ n=1 Tax=Allohahella sp. A8 TaxID=3141461 RepID=UPI003A7FCE97